MKRALLASVVVVSNVAAPAMSPTNSKFEPSPVNRYGYLKFIADVKSGLNLNDTREIGFLDFLEDNSKMNEQSNEIIEIFKQYDEILQIDPTYDITKFIKTYIENFDFINIGFDVPSNDLEYKRILGELKESLKTEKGNLTNLRDSELEGKIKGRIKTWASDYNLDYDKDESAISKTIYESIENDYYNILNNADVQIDGRPYVKKDEFVKELNDKVDEAFGEQGNISSIESEMLEKFESQVRDITLPTDFTAKKLLELIDNPDPNKFETVFVGLNAIKAEFTSKQPDAKFDVEVTYSDYNDKTEETAFTFTTSLNNSENIFKIVVHTAKYKNIAINVKDAIENQLDQKIPKVKEEFANEFLNDSDFVKFRNQVTEISDAIKTVTDYDKVTYSMKAKYDQDEYNNKMIIELEITDTTETEPSLETVSMSFKIDIDRIIDEDFEKVKEAIENRDSDSVLFTEAKTNSFAKGKIWEQHNVFNFLKDVKPNTENVEKVINDFKVAGKEYSLVGSVLNNTWADSDKNKRFIEIKYTLTEKAGQQNSRSIKIKYNITESEVVSIVERIKKLKLTADNPIDQSNIANWIDRDSLGDLKKLLEGIEGVINSANLLVPIIKVEWSKFYEENGVLHTNFTIFEQQDKDATKMVFKKGISNVFIQPVDKDAAKKIIDEMAVKYKTIIERTKDEALREELKRNIDAIRDQAFVKIDDVNVTTKMQLDAIIAWADNEMKKIVKIGLDSNYDDMINDAEDKYGDPLPPDIRDKIDDEDQGIRDELDDLDPKDNLDDLNDMLDEFDDILKDFDADMLRKAKALSNVSKYALLSISTILGAGGVISLYNALKVWTTNKKMKDIPNNESKLKSAKKMGLLSMVIGMASILGSVAIMLFIFITKGGL